MKNHWLDQAKQRLKNEATHASDVPFDRLKMLGIINDRGEVTGQLHRWNAFLAITEVKPSAGGTRQIGEFRCLKPAFGMPGGTTIDVSRDSMVAYLKDGKKIITAIWDERLGMWKEGCVIHLTADGFIRCGVANDNCDDVGNLPLFRQSHSRR